MRSRSRSRSRSPYWRYSDSRSRSASRSQSMSYSYSSRSVSPQNRGRHRTHGRMRDDDYERMRDLRDYSPREGRRRRLRSRTPSPRGGYVGGYRDGRSIGRSGRGTGGRRRRRRMWRLGLMRGRLMPTVLVTQLGQNVGRDDIGRLFSQAGHVRDVRMVSDRRTGRHKGAAYVEFENEIGVSAAVRLSGTALCGVPIMVRAWDEGGRGDWRGGGGGNGETLERNANGTNNAEVSIGWTNRAPVRGAEKSVAEQERWSGQKAATAVTELVSIDELKRLLNPSGLATTGYIRENASGRMGSRGVLGEAGGSSRSQGLQRVPLPVATGVDTATRVYVGGLTRRVECDELKRVFGVFGDVVLGEMEANDGGTGGVVAIVEFANADAARKAVGQKHVRVNGEQVVIYSKRGDVKTDVGSGLDQVGDGGVSLNSTRRAMLMQQLSRGEGVTGRRLAGDERRLETTDEKSRALLLSNMFDPSKESDGFEQDVAEDVRDECETQYGKVTHVHVEKESHGLVYVQFENVDSAEKAQKALNGRWFGGKKIGSGFIADAVYEKRFLTKIDGG